MNDSQILELPADEQFDSLNNAKLVSSNGIYDKKTEEADRKEDLALSDINCLLCCCQYGAQGEMVSSSGYRNAAPTTQSCCNSILWKKVMSSTYLYLYVILMTAICVFLLILEVLLDSKALQVSVSSSVQASTTTPLTVTQLPLSQSDEATKHLSAVLHWCSFTIICFFFLEVLIRVSVWKIEVLRNPIALCDCAVIVCSFTVNLTTTLAAGVSSPWDAISLLIIFRLIRIYSLLRDNRRELRLEYLRRFQLLEMDLSSAQVASAKMKKQIADKDFEIKQLVAHLGGGSKELDEEIQRVVESSKARSSSLQQASTSHNDYEVRLQQAIERSKAEYSGGGIVNYSYDTSSAKPQITAADVVIHHRQNSIERKYSEAPSSSKQLLSTSNNNDHAADLLNTKEADVQQREWNVGYVTVDEASSGDAVRTQQPTSSGSSDDSLLTQQQPGTMATKKLVKINPKQLRMADYSNKKMGDSRWIYRKEGEEWSSEEDDDEGIESTPSSLKRKIKRNQQQQHRNNSASAAETISTSTVLTVGSGGDGALSDHGFSSTAEAATNDEEDASDDLSGVTNDGIELKQRKPASSTAPTLKGDDVSVV